VTKDDDDFITDMKANPNTLRNRLNMAKLRGGIPWVMAALFVGECCRLSDLPPGSAEEVLAIPPPPPDIDAHATHVFLHAWRLYQKGEGPEPEAMRRRTDADLWLASLVSDVRR
jgi:hypothetical protein